MLLLPEALTLKEARNTLAMLEQGAARDGAATLAIDASPLKRFDSSALAVLLACRRLAQSEGKGFELRGAPAPLLELAGLYGVGELLSGFRQPASAA